ncbi:MAG: DUF4160 domain-containing protein [Syntrophales bacterium]|jgi:hypothetical protein|nr:DUF4160 domain-containing protein [Syntrophobacterales bacterium]MCK9364872.1 DUF4160 domain-containing protein [Syntrophales bacterium]
MPTILRVGPYRFFFYAGDHGEPVHVHVEHDDKIAKFWLEPVRLANSGGFNRLELSGIFKIIEVNVDKILEGWHEYFGD